MKQSIAGVLVALLACAAPAFAQGTRATLTGKVTNPAGAAAGNINLVVTNAAGIDRRGVSEPDGSFVFGGLAPGTYRLRVDDETFAPWSQDQITLMPGERREIAVALQLRVAPQATRGTIAGTVFGPDGRPRGEITVIITNAAGIDRRAVSEPTGAYVFGGLAPGTYKVRVEEADALPLAVDALPLAAGERRLLDLRLQPKPAPPPPPPAVTPQPPQGRETPGGRTQTPIKVEGKTAKKPEKGPASKVPEVTATDGSFEAKPDRWHFPWPKYERYSPPEKMPWVVSGGAFDPYNQNAAKGDFPVMGGDKFVNLNLQFNNAMNPRRTVAGAPQDELFYNQNLVGGFELFKGDTVFQPKSWAVRATAVLNMNANALKSFSFGNLTRKFNPAKVDDFNVGLEEAFVEKRLAVLSPAFDFVSIRGGMQNFNSDFRGYVFADNQLGVRLFGNARSNRDQYNVAYFSMRVREQFSQLHEFGSRNQDVIIANYYIQDVAPGYTAMFNVHVNRDKGTETDPVPLNAMYVGFHGDGRAGGWSLSHAFYQVFGKDDDNRIQHKLTKQTSPVDISAQMAALEVSRDADWKRYRFSLFYASGDDGADPTKAKGFDAIMDNPNLAGGQFMFWTQQKQALTALPVFTTDAFEILKEKFSLLPTFRSKFLDRSNFVNPGLIVLNGGVDLRVSPKIKAVTNVSMLRFAKADLLRALREGAVGFEDEQIGIDYGVGAKIRPFLNENLFLVVGASVLQPRGGYASALTAPQGNGDPVAPTKLFSVFAAFQVAY